MGVYISKRNSSKFNTIGNFALNYCTSSRFTTDSTPFVYLTFHALPYNPLVLVHIMHLRTTVFCTSAFFASPYNRLVVVHVPPPFRFLLKGTTGSPTLMLRPILSNLQLRFLVRKIRSCLAFHFPTCCLYRSGSLTWLHLRHIVRTIAFPASLTTGSYLLVFEASSHCTPTC